MAIATTEFPGLENCENDAQQVGFLQEALRSVNRKLASAQARVAELERVVDQCWYLNEIECDVARSIEEHNDGRLPRQVSASVDGPELHVEPSICGVVKSGSYKIVGLDLEKV